MKGGLVGWGEMNSFSLEFDEWGRLVLVDGDGQRHQGVEPVRAFPISAPDRWVSICDAEGHELVSIDNVSDLPAHVAEVLVTTLSRREFLPVINRVLSVSADADPSHWHVETDRGETRFLLSSEDDVQRLGEHGAIVVDSEGVRYLVRDVRQLDWASRRILDRYL